MTPIKEDQLNVMLIEYVTHLIERTFKLKFIQNWIIKKVQINIADDSKSPKEYLQEEKLAYDKKHGLPEPKIYHQENKTTCSECEKLPEKLERMIMLGGKYGWKFIEQQTNPPMISFTKENMRINVYHTTMTVGTCITHPKKKKTQLYRKRVSLPILEKIFENPRVHTGRGYYGKSERQAK